MLIVHEFFCGTFSGIHLILGNVQRSFVFCSNFRCLALSDCLYLWMVMKSFQHMDNIYIYGVWRC
jgi:hypothetical protein